MKEKKTLTTNMHNQETDKGFEKKFSQCWENVVQTTNEYGSIEYMSCRNWLHESCSVFRTQTNASNAVESYCKRTAK
jgi:hypothetical protein